MRRVWLWRDDVAAEKGQLSQTGWGMSALFLQCCGMRANQSTAAVYIASSLFWRFVVEHGGLRDIEWN